MRTSSEAWEKPFASESIWNLPLGNNAVYKPANIESGRWTSADEELLFEVTENDPLTRLYAPGSWNNRSSGTKSPTGNPTDEIYIRFPTDKLIADADRLSTPNNSAAILQPDGETIVQVGVLTRTEPGSPVYGWYAGEENLYKDGINGSSGGSGLSALGGTIRQGELTDSEPIRHALKINVWANKYLHYDEADRTPGHRWPAIKSDSYAANVYGGIDANFKIGSLLAIPPDVTPESLGIKSLPALKLFYALQDYGAYVADDTAWDVTAFNLQQGVKEEFEQTYGYQFETNNQNSQWFQEYYAIVESLNVVANNSPNTIGGGGTRRASLAAPFANSKNQANPASSIKVEAETMELENYQVQANSLASGGELISLFGDAALETGTASVVFEDLSGSYDVVVGYYDENDGEALMNLRQNNALLDTWSLDRDLGGNLPDSQTFTTTTIATNLTVNKGDNFTLSGTETEYEHARIDYLEFIPHPIQSI